MDKGAETTRQGLLIKRGWENGPSTHTRKKLDPYLAPYAKISSKGIQDLNVRSKTTKLWEDNTGQKLHDAGFGDDFWDFTPKPQVAKEKQ